MIGSDTVAVEVMPSVTNSPFIGNVNGMMHAELLALLGIPLGELGNWTISTRTAPTTGCRVPAHRQAAQPHRRGSVHHRTPWAIK